MNPCWSGMERSAWGRPGRAKLNPSEAAGCRRRRAVSGRGRAGERGTMPAGWRQNIMHREVGRGRGRSVDCYFGLERERVEGEREGREWPKMRPMPIFALHFARLSTFTLRTPSPSFSMMSVVCLHPRLNAFRDESKICL